MATSQDPASLQNLNPIVQPEPVGLLPLAPGWYVLAGVMLLAACWAVYRGWRHWRQNAYRRAALRELQAMRGNSGQLLELPALLKRVAMAVYPRDRIAALSGPAWHEFLVATDPHGNFSAECGTLLDRLSYGGAETLSPLDGERLLAAGQSWLRHHRPQWPT